MSTPYSRVRKFSAFIEQLSAEQVEAITLLHLGQKRPAEVVDSNVDSFHVPNADSVVWEAAMSTTARQLPANLRVEWLIAVRRAAYACLVETREVAWVDAALWPFSTAGFLLREEP